MSVAQNIIAVIFDFDDTLTDDSTSQLLKKYKVDPNDFYNNKVKALVNKEWDPTLAVMTELLHNIGNGKPLRELSNEALYEFGDELEFYQGLPELFDDLNEIAKQHTLVKPSVEFFVLSGGLEEVIRGCKIAKYFNGGIRGCRFEENKNGVISDIKNIVSFTEKTRFLFEINKGIIPGGSRKRPFNVNKEVKDNKRRIPFKNMIYVGDGLTDVPCFSLIDKNGGTPYGVFDPRRKDSPKIAWKNLLAPRRIKTLNSPKYTEDDDLGAILRANVDSICTDMTTELKTVFAA
jgi:phosphoserine phosphatase